jgi:hypothetical protein
MRTAIGIVLFLSLAAAPFAIGAESAKSLVALGNELYSAGDYDKALEAYAKAMAEQPDAGEIFFDQGNAYFRKGEYEKAREAYRAAALHTRDLALEASAQYNLGNTVFAEGQQQLETDPKQALSQWGQSIHHYQEALRINSRLGDAAQNIEVVRLAIKDLADRVKKAEEAAREQQRQREELQKQLSEVVKEQESELKENESLQQQSAQNPEAPTGEGIQKLVSDQEKTRQKTAEIADRLKNLTSPKQPNQPSAPQSKPSADPAQEPLAKAQEAQESALEKIEKQELNGAMKDQEEAVKSLKEALAKPEESTSKQDQCQNPQQGGENQEEDSKKAAPEDQSGEEQQASAKPAPQQQSGEPKPQSGKKEHGEKGDEQKASAAFTESPESIFREERENRLQLHRAPLGGIKPVDKDW